jgi:putative DNA primase/helicase
MARIAGGQPAFGELHPAVESHQRKYRKLIPGLALIIHLAEHKAGQSASVRYCRRWRGRHTWRPTRSGYASGTKQEVTAAKAIITKLRSGQLKKTFSAEMCGGRVGRI